MEEKKEKTVRSKRAGVEKNVQDQSRVKVLMSILNQEDDDKMAEILNEYSVSLSFSFSGTGTARSAVLDYLGIGETEKAVMISLIPESDEEKILREIRTRMSLYLVGKGISFTMPLSAISEIIANGIIGAATEKTTNGRKRMNGEQRKYDLIVAAVAAGNVDEAMEAARSAGAVGGTILRAMSVDNQKAQQFIGISIQKEQEILLILSRKEGKTAIMQAISDRVGLKTEAGGILFSLPVDNTVGIGATGAETDENTGGKEGA